MRKTKSKGCWEGGGLLVHAFWGVFGPRRTPRDYYQVEEKKLNTVIVQM
jgi:hypothetical protein